MLRSMGSVVGAPRPFPPVGPVVIGMMLLLKNDRSCFTVRPIVLTCPPMTTPTGRGEAREVKQRRPRIDGERSRTAILSAATELATIEGLDGLSIGRLADHVGMSKSGLYAHFKSKQELQRATIEAAQAIFAREVYEPGLDAAPGVARVYALCDAFLAYVERRVFPGGCFFAAAAAELDTHEGPLREQIRDFYLDWLRTLSNLIVEAVERGELDRQTDPGQLAFELDSLLLGANLSFVLFSDDHAPQQARLGIRQRLYPPST